MADERHVPWGVLVAGADSAAGFPPTALRSKGRPAVGGPKEPDSREFNGLLPTGSILRMAAGSSYPLQLDAGLPWPTGQAAAGLNPVLAPTVPAVQPSLPLQAAAVHSQPSAAGFGATSAELPPAHVALGSFQEPIPKTVLQGAHHTGQDFSSIFVARGITRLGIHAEEILRTHYSMYGQVLRVISQAKTKSGSQLPKRYSHMHGNLGFVIMDSPASVDRILALGPEQKVAGVRIVVEGFQASPWHRSDPRGDIQGEAHASHTSRRLSSSNGLMHSERAKVNAFEGGSQSTPIGMPRSRPGLRASEGLGSSDDFEATYGTSDATSSTPAGVQACWQAVAQQAASMSEATHLPGWQHVSQQAANLAEATARASQQMAGLHSELQAQAAAAAAASVGAWQLPRQAAVVPPPWMQPPLPAAAPIGAPLDAHAGELVSSLNEVMQIICHTNNLAVLSGQQCTQAVILSRMAQQQLQVLLNQCQQQIMALTQETDGDIMTQMQEQVHTLQERYVKMREMMTHACENYAHGPSAASVPGGCSSWSAPPGVGLGSSAGTMPSSSPRSHLAMASATASSASASPSPATVAAAPDARSLGSASQGLARAEAPSELHKQAALVPPAPMPAPVQVALAATAGMAEGLAAQPFAQPFAQADRRHRSDPQAEPQGKSKEEALLAQTASMDKAKAAGPGAPARTGPAGAPVGQAPAGGQSQREVAASDSLGMHLTQLQEEDPRCVFIARKISCMGFKSQDLLRLHYSQYGQVARVLVVSSKVKPFNSPSSSKPRIRPGSLSFIVMDTPESVEKILAEGKEQLVAGFPICVEPFAHMVKPLQSRTVPTTTSSTATSTSNTSMGSGSGSCSTSKGSAGSSGSSGSGFNSSEKGSEGSEKSDKSSREKGPRFSENGSREKDINSAEGGSTDSQLAEAESSESGSGTERVPLGEAAEQERADQEQAEQEAAEQEGAARAE